MLMLQLGALLWLLKTLVQMHGVLTGLLGTSWLLCHGKGQHLLNVHCPFSSSYKKVLINASEKEQIWLMY